MLHVAGTSINECVSTCPVTYYLSSNSTCQACSSNCLTCSNVTCQLCTSNYYLYQTSTSASCVQNCPIGFGTPAILDGSGQCSACPANCYSCVDSNTCDTCNPSFVIFNSQCTPSNCINCLSCDASANQCSQCSSGYYLYNHACSAYCPNGYFADNSTGTCEKCM